LEGLSLFFSLQEYHKFNYIYFSFFLFVLIMNRLDTPVWIRNPHSAKSLQLVYIWTACKESKAKTFPIISFNTGCRIINDKIVVAPGNRTQGDSGGFPPYEPERGGFDSLPNRGSSQRLERSRGGSSQWVGPAIRPTLVRRYDAASGLGQQHGWPAYGCWLAAAAAAAWVSAATASSGLGGKEDG
jgi:hypothetical protein